MRVIICLFVFSFSANSFAQNISINTTGSANSTNSMLEVLQPSTTSGTSGLFVRHSGATTTAYGLWLEMTGAVTNKYAIIVPSGSGSVGIGTSTPPGPLSVVSTPTVDATAYGIYNEITGTPSLAAHRTYYGVLNNLIFRPTENGFNAIANGAYNQAYSDGAYEFNYLRGAYNSAYSTSTASANQDNIQGCFNQGYLNSTGVATNVYGSYSQGINNENAVGTATVTSLYGSRNEAVTNAGTTVNQYGAFNYAYKATTGNITTAFGSYNRVRNSDATGVGAIGTAYGVYSLIDKNAAGLDFTTAYGLYSNVSAGATRWGLYVTGEQNNYLSGNVGIGLTPSYKLHVTSASGWIAKFVSTAAANGGIYVDAATGYNANIGLQENAVDKWYLGNRASNDRFSFIESSGATEVLAILQGGNVGIGTIVPGAKLSVGTDLTGTAMSTTFKSNAGALGGAVTNELVLASIGFTSSNQSALGVRAYRTAAGADWTTTAVGIGMDVDNTARAGAFMWLKHDGTMGVGMVPSGTYKLEVSGRLKSTGINETSDIRLKKNILGIDNALSKVQQLRGVTYDWRADEFKDKGLDTTRQIGLIAQEVEKIFPQLVGTDNTGFKSVEYSKMVAVLIEAIKEQQKIIDRQKAEIGTLNGTVSGMQNDISSLKASFEILLKQNGSVTGQ